MTAMLWKSLPNLISDGGLFTEIIMGEALNKSEDAALQEELKVKMLTGETEVARLYNTVLYHPSIKKDTCENNVKGLLIVTTFRLSFLSPEDKSSENQNPVYQENIFLGKVDISLSNIDQIYQISDKRKKLIGPRLKTNSKIDALQIICKNFRTLKFGFNECTQSDSHRIANALQRFAFPNQHNLLFSYKFNEKYYNALHNVIFYNLKKDWLYELQRCGAIGWRVITSKNEMPEGSLPTYYVIPKNLTDTDFKDFAKCFRSSRPAIWMYGYEGASLVRMADLLPSLLATDMSPENTMMEKIRDCHPEKKPPHLQDLATILPSIQDIQISYCKLRELCTPDNPRQFMLQDTRFFSHVEKSNWLFYVSLCLKHSKDMANKMKSGETVVLQENDGRDMSALISSLIQIILDPLYRTTNGFQSLIQKEWITMGHPFSDRLGLVISESTTEKCPLFLLFLDCVWQLLKQFPEDFEYSETYLTTLWDSVFLPIFDTFQFNCEHDRYFAKHRENLILRPVWDWGEQFSDKDIALFSNPLYKKPTEILNSRKSVFHLPANAVRLPILGASNYKNSQRLSLGPQAQSQPQQNLFLENICTNISDIEIWSQCYYRWQPYLEIQNGGSPQIELFNRVLLSNISKLQQSLQTGDFDDIPIPNTENASQINLPCINSFFPFSRNTCFNSNELGELLMNSNDVLIDGSILDGLSSAQAPD